MNVGFSFTSVILMVTVASAKTLVASLAVAAVASPEASVALTLISQLLPVQDGEAPS